MLKLEMQSINIRLTGIGNAVSKIIGEVRTTLKSRVTRFSVTENFLVLPEITQYNPSNAAVGSKWQVPTGVTLADPTFDSNKKIDMLLGVGLFFKLIVAGQIELGPQLPILQKSLLGWVVVGEYAPATGVSLLSTEMEPQPRADSDALQELVQRFWKYEAVVQPDENLTEDEKKCEENFISHVSQAESGHFVVALPFHHSFNCRRERMCLA